MVSNSRLLPLFAVVWMKVFVAGLLVVLLGHALAVTALYSPTEDATLSAGRVCTPGTYKGRLDNANYEIIIPSNWNQVLYLTVKERFVGSPLAIG